MIKEGITAAAVHSQNCECLHGCGRTEPLDPTWEILYIYEEQIRHGKCCIRNKFEEEHKHQRGA